MLRGLSGEERPVGIPGGKVSCMLSSESESSSTRGMRADVLGLRLGMEETGACEVHVKERLGAQDIQTDIPMCPNNNNNKNRVVES